MAAKGLLSFVLPVAVFVIVGGVVFLAFAPRRVEQPKPQPQDKIAGIEGLNEGDVVKLPTLATVSGETVSLDQTKGKTILCAFFSPSCAGCNKDIGFWRDLKEESSKREAAFYIIDVGSDTEALQKFISAYKLEALPVLHDPNHRIGPDLKINFVPTYVLFTKTGEVIRRWDGVRNRDGAGKVDEFFYAGERP
ncbi:MAG TPA: TlpA disulfide reductase family protein [Pyrinomonadaceae bacterium]